MAKKTNDIDIHTFQIVPADESSVATPRFDEVEEIKGLPAVKKSTSFKEISEAKVAAKNKPKLMSKIHNRSSKPKSGTAPKPQADKNTEILKGLVFGMGIVFVFIFADFILLAMK